MELIADILLAAGAIAAGFYCFVLGRRLNHFNNLEKGVGGAVAVLSAQVDDLSKMLGTAQAAASASAETLSNLTARAEQTSQQLELQMASLHDVPDNLEPASQRETTSPSPTIPSQGEPMFTRRTAGSK